jgi:hypothetical protein
VPGQLTEESRAAAAAGSARVAPAGFVLKRQIPLLAYPRAIAVGDFDRDGRKDLAVVNSRPATVSILFGLGKGRFGRRHSVAVPENAQAIAVANLDPGGRPDLVIGIASYWGDDGSYHPHRVVVRLGRGDGTFEAGRTYGRLVRILWTGTPERRSSRSRSADSTPIAGQMRWPAVSGLPMSPPGM